jgi:peptidoglycan/LPS O-acetylase OafA/YrhL
MPNQYRPDVDGLRAVAVLLVVLHHLGPWLPGGFVGVDVFFVISGFLITRHIAETAGAGTFSFSDFYKRRINRILPALLLVLAATLLAGLAILSPGDYLRLAKSALTAVLGFSNVFFWREYGSYFAGDATEAPLLHTWSLGVEEQFYLLWPVFAVLLVKLRRRWLLPILVGALVGGIALSQFGVSIALSASYYLLHARFFELLTGAALALGIRSERRLPSVFGWIGLGLIAASAFMLSAKSAFPGLNALSPCLGAALLIWSGGVAPLRSKPVMFIGLISYSLYLWHWPVIAYVNYLGFSITPAIGTAVLAGSTGLAWATWRYVETPARRSGARLRFALVFSTRFAVPVAAVAAFSFATLSTAGFSGRFDVQVADLEQQALTKPDELREGCHVRTALFATAPNPQKCRLGATGDKIDAILLGDSYANHFTGMIDVLAARSGITIMPAAPGLRHR